MEAKGTFNELYENHLSLLTTMKEDNKNSMEDEEINDLTGDESIAKEAEAISKDMKAREEVVYLISITNYHNLILIDLFKDNKKRKRRNE